MTKRASMERHTIVVATAIVGILFFISSVCMLLTEELSSAWQKVGSSASSFVNAQIYLSQRIRQGFIPPLPRYDDDPTCLSRSQQYLYRKPAGMAPIPAPLFDAWASYVDMHRSCFHRDWTELFSSRDRPSTAGQNGCRYLVYAEGGEGLGNVFLSLMTAFMFAMATDRVLLLDSRKNIARLLCEPFPGSSWVLPSDFPYAELLSSPSLEPFLLNNVNASCVSLNLQHNILGGDQQFFCEKSYAALKDVKWVAWKSNQYFLTNLFLIPSFWQRIHPIVEGSVGHIFTYLSRLLLLPANDTWLMILRQFWSYLAGAKVQLGVQVRLHGRPDLAEFDPKADTMIMDCLLQNGLLPGFSDMENLTELAVLHSRKIQVREKAVDIVVLLASLQGKYGQRMKDHFTKLPTKGAKMVRVHSVSELGSQNRGFEQAQLAFVEMWLLSISDYLATSEFSTFGYVAQGLGDLHPYILGLKMGEHALPCVLGQSSEPCTHYPKIPGCFRHYANLSIEHKHWIRMNFRQCQDHAIGWQLVPRGAGGSPVSFEFL